MPLLVVATPIGNRGDLSPRAREALATADLVLAEDTRHSRALLAGLEIPAPPMMSCHAHNEQARLDEVMARLERGEVVALITDAGTPAISDPGGRVVRAAHEAGHPVRVVPGPSSVIAALSVSGLPATPFHFLGFPPRKAGELRSWIAEASRLPGALVMLESGRRLGELLAALAEALPDREATVCRELSKLHEEVRLAPLPSLPAEAAPGEVVLVVGPGAPVAEAEVSVDGEGLGPIAAALARRWGCPRREAYQRLLALEAALKPR